MVSSPSLPNVAIGELLWDLLPTGARLGGTTTNYAVLSARLGEFSALVSCVGDDELGNEAVERLCMLALDPVTDSCARIHLNLNYVQTSTELPTGTVVVTLDEEGRPHYDIVSPVAWDAIKHSPALLQLAASASSICFGTLAQRYPASQAAIRSFIAAARPGCVRVCDLNLRKPFCNDATVEWCLAHADVIKVSDEELPEVGHLLGESILAAGLPNQDGEELTHAACNAADALLRLAPQCRLIAITLGPHGSLLADRFGTHRHHGIRVKVVDTIGAGDAFTAGMVHAYMRRTSLAQISNVANLCGSYVASQPGATPKLPLSLLKSVRDAMSENS